MAILATLCYLRKNGKTLMLRSLKNGHFKENLWNGLGGKLEKGETPEECVIRETEEESGYKISNPKLVGLLTFPNQNSDGNDWYVFVYKATKLFGKLKQSAEGEVKWVKNEDVLKLNMSEGDYIFLPWIFENKFFSAKFIYKNGKLLSHSVSFPH